MWYDSGHISNSERIFPKNTPDLMGRQTGNAQAKALRGVRYAFIA